jgi:ribosomal protein S18 acetylase RimI-like enzyme
LTVVVRPWVVRFSRQFAMSLTYFKRYRMEFDLARLDARRDRLPEGYRFVPWHTGLLEAHATTKYESFRHEIDANVFSCLGEYDGCYRLMTEISRKEGFLPQATWLLAYMEPRDSEPSINADPWAVSRDYGPVGGRDYDVPSLGTTTFCGTVQGIEDRFGYGAIQNLGVVPEHRGRGLGSVLLMKALEGFRRAGLKRAYLEVTAQNDGAVRLYRRLGFVKARTVYKAVELMGVPVR